MTEPKVTLENANTGGSVILRRALFGGMFACIGASAGWLFWIGLQKGRTVLIAPAIGVVIELARKGYGYYEKRSLKESVATTSGFVPDADEKRRNFKIDWPSVRRHARITLPIVLAIFLGVAADLIKDNLLQFVQSLAVFFPVGAVFAVAFNKDSFQSENVLERLPYGVTAGIAATMASLLIFFAMGGTGAIANIYSGWWVLVGVCFAAVHVDRTTSTTGFFLAPLAGILVLLFAMLVLVTFNLDRFAVSVFKVIPASINSLLIGPDLPATSWTKPPEPDAEKKVKDERKALSPEPESAEPVEPNRVSAMLGCAKLPALNIARTEITAGCDDSNSITPLLAPRDWVSGIRQGCIIPACDNLNAECPVSVLMDQIPERPSLFEPEGGDAWARLAKRKEVRDACLQRAKDCDSGIEWWVKWLEEHPYADHYLIQQAMEAELPKEPHTFRRRMLCKQLRLGLGSGLVRSLLAVIFFSIFWGWARSVEQKTRPENYEASRVRRMDRMLLLAVAVFIAAVILLSRLNAAT